jgi:hypothetical protein
MNKRLRYGALPLVLMVAACATVPTGPSVMALPGTGKQFDEFRADDASCRQFAFDQIGGMTANQAATDSALKSGAVGALVGAAAGAIIGGRNSTGVGAGTGLLFGSVAGAGAADSSAYGAQRRYDNAYIQCMYAKGDRVPVAGRLTSAPATAYESAPAPRAGSIPPPPPGSAPPAPPNLAR